MLVDRIDYCTFGNSKPFRIRIKNQYNDNYDYFYIKKLLAAKTDEDILSLPLLDDETRVLGLEMLLRSADQAYYAGDPLTSMVGR